MTKILGKDSPCSIARGLDVLGEKWTLLIVREALLSGTTRFQDFREALGMASNVLTDRLAKLVDEGVMERRTYREDGVRERSEYVLTEAGRGLNVVIAGLSDWGRKNRPKAGGTSPSYTLPETGEKVELAFVTPDGHRVDPATLATTQTPDRKLA